jgi:signal transduction histidine kinase
MTPYGQTGLLSKAWSGIAALTLLIAVHFASAHPTDSLLTNASDVLSLSAKQASKHFPVFVRGVVTAAESQWHGQFFVQDSTGGIFVENNHQLQPRPGDVLEISGVSHQGAFAPIISQPVWKKVGTGPLPAAAVVPIEQVMSGSEDSQRVEVSGIVRAAQITKTKSNLDLDIAAAGYRLHAFPQLVSGLDPQRLVGATVRLRGTAAASLNPGLRRLVAVNLFIPQLEDFIVETSESGDPFAEPLMALNSIARYRRKSRPSQRVHVRGAITYQSPGQELFLQDESGGLRVESHLVKDMAVGDVVEAVGFADIENFLPVLQDAVFRKTSEHVAHLAATNVTLQIIQAGQHHAALVTLKGKLLERFVRRDQRTPSCKSRAMSVLMIQSDNVTFTAETEAPEAIEAWAAIPVGGTIEVSGVCVIESGEDGKARSFQILMPTEKGVRILARPSWLTPERLMKGLAILLAVSMLAVGWTVMVSKKNVALTVLIREKEKARLELREARDQLEEKVKERTAQLKLQISARKESELQFKAVLGERTRLAQELHDTLEQTLTGIRLHMDASARLLLRNPESAGQRLEHARNLMSQSQIELRRSVWDLRCRALEQFDLPGALLRNGRQITFGTGIEVDLETKGEVRVLPEVVEENLLRICQEALTNVIKHSEASLAQIELEFDAQHVILQVKDDGKGFAPDDCVGPREGHFGLLGMAERAKRLGGEVVLSSALGAGATVRVVIPLGQAPEIAVCELVTSDSSS